MAFIARRQDGTIYGCWTVKQFEGQEELPDDHADVVSFFAPKTPIDLSNVDNLEKSLKALALCVAQVGGLTPTQIRTMFKQKWDSLT
jgi:hypothetical protein